MAIYKNTGKIDVGIIIFKKCMLHNKKTECVRIKLATSLDFTEKN